jgi:hypothetical protein
MVEKYCSYSGDREAALVGCLYDDIDPIDQASFEAHLSLCERCRVELEELQAVRARLGHWAAPEPARRLKGAATIGIGARWTRRLGSLPAWMQVAAAILILGVAAGIANLNVRYDGQGLTIRTGWSGPSAPADASPARGSGSPAVPLGPAAAFVETASGSSTGTEPPWRADLVALEQQLRHELRASRSPDAAAGAAATNAAADPELMRRVRALIAQSEQRQERELALRIAGVMRDVDAQRRADLVKIDRSLGLIQNNTGVEVMKQRELLNYLVRVSQKQ